MSIAAVKRRSSMPKATIEQVEIGGRVCISYMRGDAKKFRELSLAYEKKFPPRARRPSDESAVDAVRAIRDGRN